MNEPAEAPARALSDLHGRARALASAMLAAAEVSDRQAQGKLLARVSDDELKDALVTVVLRFALFAVAHARGLVRGRALAEGRLFETPCVALDFRPELRDGCIVAEPHAVLDSAVQAHLSEFCAAVAQTQAAAAAATKDVAVELLGNLYELLVGERVTRSSSGAPRAFVAGSERKRSGTFFTPRTLTRIVAELGLATLEQRAPSGTATARDAALAVRVCDPAVGGAAFLVEVGRLLLARASQPGDQEPERRVLSRALVSSVLHGVDVSSLAVAVAEASLWLFVGDADFPLRDAGLNLRVGDALIGEPELDQTSLGALSRLPGLRPLDWPAAFPGIFARGGFDLVIGNPPWVAYAGRAAKPLEPARKLYFSRNYAALRGYPTLHGLFVERATRLCPNGTVALVVPSPIADLDGYRAVRRAVRRGHRVREPLLEFGQDAFASVTQPCFALIAAANSEISAEVADAPFRLAERQRAQGTAAEVRVPNALQALFELPPFPAELFGELGFQTNRRVTETLLSRMPEPNARHHYPLLEGRDVREFWQGPPRLFLAPDAEALSAARCRLRPRADFGRARFVVRQTARYPIAALHGGLPFRNSLLAGFEVPPLSPELVVGLLNSALYRALHLSRRRDARQAAFPQVKIAHLRALPNPPGEARERRAIAALSVRAMSAGVNAELCQSLDDAVFDLFRISAPNRREIVEFLAARAPELRRR